MMLRVLLSLCLVILGLMMRVNSHPVPHTACPKDCKPTKRYTDHGIHHLPADQGKSSVAPWTLQDRPSSEVGNELDPLQVAVCKTCTVKGMVAKPIYIGIHVFKWVRNGEEEEWCKCPYQLAVGCTCVKE